MLSRDTIRAPRNLQYGYYLIAFVDVLGQRDWLRRLRALPDNEREACETIRILQNTAGIVVMLRDSFKTCFDKCAQTGGGLRAIAGEQQPLAQQVTRFEIDVRGISDSIIISVSLSSEYDSCTAMNGIIATFGGLCGIFALSLFCGHPIRAGVDVGLGLRVAPDEVYGPALERAHFLEAKCAKYPRMVIGKELYDYLVKVESQTESTPHARCAKQNAARCKTFLSVDTDGQQILDWLGPGPRPFIDPMMNSIVTPAYEFVTEQERRYLSVGDAKLSERYARLRGYMAARMDMECYG
jgi:hypothetical protein